jgi:hypothetical protein
VEVYQMIFFLGGKNMQQQPQNMTQPQQAVMQQPPEVITTKDAFYLRDMLSWNLLAMKKAHFFAQQCQIPDIVNAMHQAGQMHQRHYQKILQHMQNHLQNKQPAQQAQQQPMQ